MKPDPALVEVREVRHRISASVEHDPRKLVEHYQRLQERHKERIVVSRNVEHTPRDESAA